MKDLVTYLSKIVLKEITLTQLFVNKSNSDMFFVKIYVDDIIFGSTNPPNPLLCKQEIS